MHIGKNLKKLKIILILVYICSGFFATFIYTVFKDVPILSALLHDYFTSGKSFFFPAFPYINVFWFLPEEFQIVQFSVGQLIDVLMVVNIFCYIDTILYHYIKLAYLNNDDIYRDLYYYGSNGKVDELAQNPEEIFGFNNKLRYNEDNLLGFNERNFLFNERINNFFNHLRSKELRNNKRKSEFILINHYINVRVSWYHSFFKKLWISLLKNHYQYPKNSNSTYSNENFTREGV